MSNILIRIKDFIVDYCQRHAHPINAILHLIGVPSAFYGIYKLFTGSIAYGLSLLVLGYWLQYLGHKAQGNEVGEVTLIKKYWRLIQSKQIQSKQNKKSEI